MGYWPSYSEIPPACRSGYLHWLANGRSDPHAYIGYVFLFFYGLERWTLYDSANQDVPLGEAQHVVNEVGRLLSVYGENRSFRGYATSFLSFLDVASGNRIEMPETNSGSAHTSLPNLAAEVGRLAQEGRRLPATTATRWLLADPEFTLRTPARRCPQEFEALFATRFEQRFGDGLKLRAAKRNLVHRYKPATASLGGSCSITTDLPDTFSLTAPRRRLAELAEECCSALDAFSRRVRRDPQIRETVSGLALLPPELMATFSTPSADALRAELSRHADSENFLDLETLVDSTLQISADDLKKKDATLLAQAIERLGFGIEPDVRFGSPTPKPGTKVAVFRLGEDSPTAPSPAYTAATLLLHLAVMVASSDDDISLEEREQFERHVTEGLHLSAAERIRLHAHLCWLQQTDLGWAGLKRRIQGLDHTQRERIGEFLVEVALADGRVDPREVKILTRIYRNLELDPGTVHADIHRLSTATNAASDAPVSVRPASSATSHPIPPRPANGDDTADEGLSLDMERISSRLEETASVSALLASVFEDADANSSLDPSWVHAEPSQSAASQAKESGAAGARVHGLDAAHTALLVRLGASASWSRADFEELVEELRLFPDGALDRLNDVAFEVCDECLCDGDDPIDVDLDIHARLVTDVPNS